MLQITLCALEHAATFDTLMAVMNTLRRHGTIWACMNARGRIVEALYHAHQSWKARGIQVRKMLDFLTELDQGKYLDLESQGHVQADMISLTSVRARDEAREILLMRLPGPSTDDHAAIICCSGRHAGNPRPCDKPSVRPIYAC